MTGFTKKKTVRLFNNRSGEEWLCDDYNNIRNVDGVEFVEVYKENNVRKFWMNKSTLVKSKKNTILSSTKNF